ncbi:MAG: ribonuclease HII [Candidatus Omnitrophica bacterium]|nr:ribonuclease HII [Candidatus Omnitrophota bacterium]
MWRIEQSIFDQGFESIAGVDEAGRGPLAGPVVAAAVIVPKFYEFSSKVTDSKKLSAAQRQRAYEEIIAKCIYAFAVVDENQIDKYNILQASLLAMADAIHNLSQKPEWVLIDGVHKPALEFPMQAIIKGDSLSISIASASIVAKVIRDSIMIELDREYPQYGFAIHKGYGTKSHLQSISAYGPCPIHRKTFQPIKGILSK